MNKPLLLAAPALAAAMLTAACSNGKPYAHEAKRHPTAAEQLFGESSNGTSTLPASSATTDAQPTEPMVVPQPTFQQPAARSVPNDSDFMQRQIASSALEIELARVAFVRAQSPEVRSFARQMLIDHRQMVVKMDDFALQRGYLVSWQIDPEGVNTVERLRSIDSASFDRAYMDEMVMKHEIALSSFELQAASGRETAALSAEVVPTVRHHLDMARELRTQL